MGLIFALETGLEARRNISVFFRLCSHPKQEKQREQQQEEGARPGVLPGLFEAGVDATNGTVCNKLYIKQRYQCRTTAKFDLLVLSRPFSVIFLGMRHFRRTLGSLLVTNDSRGIEPSIFER